MDKVFKIEAKFQENEKSDITNIGKGDMTNQLQ